MINHYQLDDAYKNYFSKKESTPVETTLHSTAKPHTHATLPIEADGSEIRYPKAKDIHDLIQQDEDSLEMACRLIQRLLDTAWGSGWGVMTLDSPTGMDPSEVVLPCIVVDMNNREIPEGRSPKPMRIDTIKEVINGVETGDHFLIYRQWYDCILEFDFYGKNTKEARQLMHRFETLMASSVGFLKKDGISEIFFLKEVSPKQSVNYSQHVAMRCSMYYYRFEKDYVIRASSLNQIEMELNAQPEGFAESRQLASDLYNDPAIKFHT